jgi:hypothetical protein
MPQDPASGAARSTRTICEMLAAAGFEVHALATTATERDTRADPVAYLQQLAISVTVDAGRSASRVRPELHFRHRGIQYRLLHVGPRGIHGWQQVLGRQFDALFDRALHEFAPDVLFGYGGTPGDEERFRRARRQGVRTIFSLAQRELFEAGVLRRL